MVESVIVSIDLGSSLTKVVWSRAGEQNCHFLTMEPEVLPCAEEHLRTLQTARLQLYSSSQQDLWVKLNKNSQPYAIGFLARTLCAQTNLQALKFESALYKILAVAGEIAQGLNSTNLELKLGLLLPWSEWSDRVKLKMQLSKALKSFWFRGNCYKVGLRQWKCLPEGAGISIHRCQEFSDSRNPKVVTLVFGYRNTSCLIFEQGRLTSGDTTTLGFYQLLEEILRLTSGQDRHQLTPVVYQLSQSEEDLTSNSNSQIIYSLCRSQQSENKQQEADQIIEAIATARRSYWELVRGWLLAKIPNLNHIHETVIAGGTAQYLYSQLSQYFSEIRTYWGTDLQERIENEPHFQTVDCDNGDPTALAYRFVDGYAHHCLQVQAEKLEVKKIIN